MISKKIVTWDMVNLKINRAFLIFDRRYMGPKSVSDMGILISHRPHSYFSSDRNMRDCRFCDQGPEK